MSRKRIVIVEDEQDMADLVLMRLRREQYDAQVAFNGVDGLRLAQADPPNLVLLDIMLPGMSGIEVLRELRSDPRTAGVPVIMLTAKGEEGDIVAGLQLGADDYVIKPFSMSVLMARIAAVLRRGEQAGGDDATVLKAGAVRINRDTHEVEVEGKAITLTLTEFRLLVALVAARGRVLTRNQLIDHAMGMDAVVTDRTIDVHLAALRRKLGKARRLIQTVRGVGYRLANFENETA